MKRVLIVGAGAIGGFLAARLIEGGADVTVLVRPARAEALGREGLILEERGGRSTWRPTTVTADQLFGPYDLVIVAVKSEGLAVAMDDFAPAVADRTVILPFLNGMRHLEPLVERFGDAVVGGALRVVAELDDRGAIRVLAPMFEAEVGALDGGSSAGLAAVVALLRDAGATVTTPDDIVASMWMKWAFIASIGTVTSLMRADTDEIVAFPEGIDFARAVVDEVAAVCAGAGRPVPAPVADRMTAMVTGPTGPATSSLSRELLAGRHTEVDPVVGDMAAIGRSAGVATPLLDLTTLALRIHNRRVDGS
jgi:2-dehydropantoate 2-reductase